MHIMYAHTLCAFTGVPEADTIFYPVELSDAEQYPLPLPIKRLSDFNKQVRFRLRSV